MTPAETVLITGSLGQDARLLVELLDNQNVNLILTSKDTLKSKFIFGAVKAPNLHEYLDISTPLLDILVTSDDFLRKKDHSNLHGNSEKIYRALGWEPSYSFENMVQQIQIMVLKNYKQSGLGS